MAIHIATVGNDPAPVALGFLHASAAAPVTEAVLLLDPPRDELVRARQQALQDWLAARGSRVRTSTLQELQAGSLAGSSLNLTGGSKPSVRPLFDQALRDGAGVFTVDAHGRRLVVHDIVAGSPRPVASHLTTRDYLALYLPDAVKRLKRIEVGERRMPALLSRTLNVSPDMPFLQVPSPDPRYGPNRSPFGAWLVVQNSHLYVVWDETAMRVPKEQQSRARLLARLTRELGGQLATPVFSMPDFDPALRSDGLLEYVTTELGASIVSDQREWRAEPARAGSVGRAPLLTESEVPAANVYVVLLGAQPMPGIIGIQAQDVVPDQVYLLTTPGVQRTAERVQSSLSTTPQLAGSGLEVLPVDENAPHLLAQVLQQIAGTHPHARLTLNLTGGTKALALHALKWAAEVDRGGRVATEFTQQQRVGDGREPHWHLSLEQELQVRGVRIGSSRDVPASIPSVVEAATALFVAKSDRRTETFRAEVAGHFPGQFKANVVSEGLAAEYLSILGLAQALLPGSYRHLRWATQLIFPSSERPEGFSREVDGLAILNDGRLLLMETKRDLLSGIQQESETLQMTELAERLSGLHAHALIVGGCQSLGRASELRSWEEATRLSGTLQDAFSVWSLAPNHPHSQPDNVYRFPEDLPGFFSPSRGVS